jgi:murein DD-endopeptidase MepM/ murein hydrolase activator NlpD
LPFSKITIVLIPENVSKMRQFRIPKVLIAFLFLILFTSLSGFSWIVSDYRGMKSQIPALSLLRQENEQQEKAFLYLARRIDRITSKFSELDEFDRKLRALAEVNTAKDPPGHFTGVGGSDPEVLRPGYSMAQTRKELVRFMHRSLDNLSNDIAVKKQDKAELHAFFENQKIRLACTPSIWPTKGWLSSRFGYRSSPFSGEKEFHRGIDLATRLNAEIVAPANGIVTFVGRDHGYGKMLTIKHGYGIVTKYAHLQKALVKMGQRVKRGDKIALVGNTGRSTGPHLHYEVHMNGVSVNPLQYVLTRHPILKASPLD